jgi:di/tricarboxylate transporter
MSADLGIVLALLAGAIVMFAIGRPRMDAVALLMLAALPLTGVTDYGLTVLGFRRGSAARPYGHLDEPLRIGDALLVFGSWKQIDALRYAPDDLILLRLPAERGEVLAAVRRAPQAVAVLALVVVLMVSGLVPNVQPV